MVMEEHDASRQEQLSIIYAVLPGLNDLSKEITDEDFRKFMTDSFNTFNSVIELWGGKINKYMGDSFMASFGISDGTDNDALKCIGAALEILDRVNDLTHKNDFTTPLAIRIGIASGNVVLGTMEPGNEDKIIVMGETVSIATRLSDIAENGQVLSDENTYEQIKARFECQALEPVPLKGLSKPLPVFQVVGKKRPKVSLDGQAGRMIFSDMIGRTNEYKLLEQQVKQLINGRGGVVNITGMAGLGKSRLMAELKNSELLSNVAIFEGRAVSNGHNLSFHPVTQIIRSWAGIREKDSSQDAKAKLYRNISRIHPEANDEIFPFIATMMGYRLEGKALDRTRGIEGDALENLILKNMRDLLSKAASIRPIVIVIEDAHWSDTSSIVVLESLFKLVRKNRILFINVFRPGYRETGGRLIKFLEEEIPDHYTSISIESLSGEQSEELIENLLLQTELPGDIKKLVIDRASGNPFFIEEVIRSFIDEGLIEAEGKQFRLTENIKYANIPESIDHVLLSRIDRLDDITRNLLKTASVIGRNFYFKILQEAAETIEELDNRLGYLKDIQLLNERKHKDEVEFLFKHALAQQATYESILETSRKELHLKIANSIEKVFAGRIHEFYGTLAHHYSKAGKTDKTEEYLIKAGDESMKSGASSVSTNFFKEALDLIQQRNNEQDLQTIIDLKEKLAYTSAVMGQTVESISYCDDVIAYYYKPFPKSNFKRYFDLFVNILLLNRAIYFYKYNAEPIINEVNRKLAKIIIVQSSSLAYIDPRRLFFDSNYGVRFVKRKEFGKEEAIVIMLHSAIFFQTGIFFNLGKRIVEWGVNYLDEKLPLSWIRGKFCVTMLDYDIGNKADISDEEKVLRYGIQIGEFFYTTNYYFYTSLSLIESGEEKLFRHLLNRILQVSEAFDSSSSLTQYHRVNITYHLKYRKLHEMIRLTDDIIDFIRTKNYHWTLLALYCFRSMAYTFLDDLPEARKNLAEAEKFTKSLKIITLINIYLIAKCHLGIAEFRQMQGKTVNAGNIIKTTKKLVRFAWKVRKNLPEVYRLRANIFWSINKANKALRNFEKSVKAGIDYDCKLELSRTYFEAGKFLRDQNNKKDRINGMNGTECLIKAKSLFEEMGLEWDIREYNTYLSSKGPFTSQKA